MVVVLASHLARGWPLRCRGQLELATHRLVPSVAPFCLGISEGSVQPRAVEGGSLSASPALRLPWGTRLVPGLPLLEYSGLLGAWSPRLLDGGWTDRVFHHDTELAGGAGGTVPLGSCSYDHPPGGLGDRGDPGFWSTGVDPW